MSTVKSCFYSGFHWGLLFVNIPELTVSNKRGIDTMNRKTGYMYSNPIKMPKTAEELARFLRDPMRNERKEEQGERKVVDVETKKKL